MAVFYEILRALPRFDELEVQRIYLTKLSISSKSSMDH